MHFLGWLFLLWLSHAARPSVVPWVRWGVLGVFIVEELVVEVEVAFGENLEEGLTVEVDLVIVLVGLVVDIGVGEAA